MMNAERRKQWKRIATGFGRVTVRKNSWGFIRCLKSEPMLIDAPTRIFFHMNHSTKDQENLYIKLNDFVAFSIEEDRKTKKKIRADPIKVNQGKVRGRGKGGSRHLRPKRKK